MPSLRNFSWLANCRMRATTSPPILPSCSEYIHGCARALAAVRRACGEEDEYPAMAKQAMASARALAQAQGTGAAQTGGCGTLRRVDAALLKCC